MCGVLGFIGKLDRERIKDANSTIAHRGPDAEGFWFDDENGVALCHRRLSILDLTESGAQPMRSHTGRYTISYNGEIYNFREIVKKISPRQWRGHSDTEVLLACFEEWGVRKTLDSIDGMFAIILWDSHERSLTLMRDRIGEKPLYYGKVKGQFVVASELKPIMHLFKSELSLNPIAIRDFFHRSCISGKTSIFQEIEKLGAGSFLTISLESLKNEKPLPAQDKYWSLQDISKRQIEIVPDVAVINLEEKLKNAIEKQMISDVPIGAFLSGGVDSSLIVSLMQSMSANRVKTFSIGFENDQYNEAHFAKAVAKYLGTDHEELYVSKSDLLNQIPNLAKIYDEPFADSSQIPTILVSKMARRHVTVSLSGDGGDELFAGYNRHVFAHRNWPRVSQIPYALRSFLGKSLIMLPPSAWSAVFSVLSSGVSQPHEKIFKLAQSLKAFSMSDFYRSVSTHWNDSTPMLNKELLINNSDWNVSSAFEMSLADASWYMPDDVLVKVDRAAMSQSLETRAPFLSRDIVEMAFSVPMDVKIRDGKSKWILRQILNKYVPQNLIERQKMGFGVPMDEWLRTDLKEWSWSLLNPTTLANQNILDSNVVLEKWEAHQKGDRNYFTELWDVLMFLSWQKEYGFYR